MYKILELPTKIILLCKYFSTSSASCHLIYLFHSNPRILLSSPKRALHVINAGQQSPEIFLSREKRGDIRDNIFARFHRSLEIIVPPSPEVATKPAISMRRGTVSNLWKSLETGGGGATRLENKNKRRRKKREARKMKKRNGESRGLI